MVLQTLRVEKRHDHVRLDVFLTETLVDVPSRTFVRKLIDFGHVRVNETVVKASHKVAEGDDVAIEIPKEMFGARHIEPERVSLDIFYEDERLIVIYKPSGMIVHPAQGCYSGTLVNALLYHSIELSRVNSDMRPGIVHRLDKDTSGLLLIAKDNITHAKLARQFQRHQIKKKYVALVEGEIEFDEGLVDLPIGRHPRYREKRAVMFDDKAKESMTMYRVIQRAGGVTFVALFPKTGRTHQLRVHMSHLGHPILGDDKYGKGKSFFRLALHAQAIGFRHPQTGSYLEFSSRVPGEFFDKVAEEKR